MKVGAVSGDLVVKLALGAAAIAIVYVWWRNFNVGDAARRAGNAAVDAAATNPLRTGATTVGAGLVATVDFVPGLTDYLKRISDTNSTPAPEIAPGVVDVGGQTYDFNF